MNPARHSEADRAKADRAKADRAEADRATSMVRTLTAHPCRAGLLAATLALAACGSVASKSPADAAGGTGGSSTGGDSGAPDRGDVAGPSDTGNAGVPDTAGDRAGDAGGAPCNLARPFGAPAPVTSLNTTGFQEIDVGLSNDGRTAIVSSNRTTTGTPGGFDLYIATRASATGDFGTATALPPVLNTARNERKPVLSPDGLTLFFSSDQIVGDAGYRLMIYVATRPNLSSDFGSPGLVAGINPSGLDFAGGVSSDGRILYFDSAGATTRDMFTKDLTSNSPPAPITELNTDLSDAFPVISGDGRTIYFATMRALPGVDAGADAGPKVDFDVWVARRASASGPFSNLAPVTELNTASTDVPNWLSPDGCTIYISTDRDSPSSDRHIWAATKPAN